MKDSKLNELIESVLIAVWNVKTHLREQDEHEEDVISYKKALREQIIAESEARKKPAQSSLPLNYIVPPPPVDDQPQKRLIPWTMPYHHPDSVPPMISPELELKHYAAPSLNSCLQNALSKDELVELPHSEINGLMPCFAGHGQAGVALCAQLATPY